MLFCCLFTQWIRIRSLTFLGRSYFYKFYYAHLDTAFVISFAFGVAFTVALLRKKERRSRIVGWTFVPFYLILFALTLWSIKQWHAFGSP